MEKRKITKTQLTDSQLYTLMYQAEHDGAFVGAVRGAFAQTEDGFFQEASSAFRFPHYFGWNWAAFDECITDLEWLRFSRLVFVVDHAENLFRIEKKQAQCVALLKKHLEAAAEYWETQGVPFDYYLNSSDPD